MRFGAWARQTLIKFAHSRSSFSGRRARQVRLNAAALTRSRGRRACVKEHAEVENGAPPRTVRIPSVPRCMSTDAGSCRSAPYFLPLFSRRLRIRLRRRPCPPLLHLGANFGHKLAAALIEPGERHPALVVGNQTGLEQRFRRRT
jgi:hypothetical protein